MDGTCKVCGGKFKIVDIYERTDSVKPYKGWFCENDDCKESNHFFSEIDDVKK